MGEGAAAEKRAMVRGEAAAVAQGLFASDPERICVVEGWTAGVEAGAGRRRAVWRGLMRGGGGERRVVRRGVAQRCCLCFGRGHRCERHVRQWLNACGRCLLWRGIRHRCIERGGKAVVQGGKQLVRIHHACCGRHDVGDGPGERGKQDAQGVGIDFLQRGVENCAELGAEARAFLWGEGRIVIVAEQWGDGPRGAASAKEQSREASGPGGRRWRDGFGCARAARGVRWSGRGARVGISGHGVADAGWRRCRASQNAGQNQAAGDGVAHRTADAADEARANPRMGLGRTVRRQACIHHEGQYGGR